MCTAERRGSHETHACDVEVVVEEVKDCVGRRLEREEKKIWIDNLEIQGPKYSYFNKCKEAAPVRKKRVEQKMMETQKFSVKTSR